MQCGSSQTLTKAWTSPSFSQRRQASVPDGKTASQRNADLALQAFTLLYCPLAYTELPWPRAASVIRNQNDGSRKLRVYIADTEYVLEHDTDALICASHLEKPLSPFSPPQYYFSRNKRCFCLSYSEPVIKLITVYKVWLLQQ